MMLYQSKIYNILVNKFREGREGALASGCSRRRRLSGVGYVFGGGEGKEVERREAGIVRRIVRQGESYTYILGSRLARHEYVLLEEAKNSATRRVSSEGAAETTIEKVLESAYGELSGRLGRDRGLLLAYIVAHEAAGAGIFSMLMDDAGMVEGVEVVSAYSPVMVSLHKYGRCRTNLRFSCEEAFRSAVDRLLSSGWAKRGRACPSIDVKMIDSRIDPRIRPYLYRGPVVSVRAQEAKKAGIASMVSSGVLNAEAAAYLWIAMESGMSMVFSGPAASQKAAMMEAVAGFISHADRLVAIGNEIAETRLRRAMVNTAALRGADDAECDAKARIAKAVGLVPDRITCSECTPEEAGELLKGAGFGVPFMASASWDEEGPSLIGKLLAKPAAFMPRHLGMLDMTVKISHDSIGSSPSLSICEYRWMSRCETEAGFEVAGRDMVETVIIAQRGAATEASVLSSKVLRAFALNNRLSPEAAQREAIRRISLIRKATKIGDDELSKRIESFSFGD